MGDEHEGDTGLALQAFELGAHFLAEFQIKRRERLIEQQHLGARGHGAGERDALLLAAGELRRLAVDELAQLHHPDHLVDACDGVSGRPLEHFERETDVIGDAHMREERVILEDSVHRALVGGQVFDFLAVEVNGACGGAFKSGDHTQKSAFAAARRAKKREKLVVGDVECDLRKRGEGAEILADLPQGNRRVHQSTASAATSRRNGSASPMSARSSSRA